MINQFTRSHSSARFFIAAIGVILIALALKELQSIILPFLVAYLLVFVFSPLNDLLLEKRIPNWVLIPLNLLIITGIGFGLTRLIIDSGIQLTERFETYAPTFNNLVQETASSLGLRDPELRAFSVKRFLSRIDIKPYLGDAFNSVFSAVGAIALTLFFFVFIQSGHKAIMEAIKRAFIRRQRDNEVRRIEQEKLSGTVNYSEHTHVQSELDMIESRLEDTQKTIIVQIQRYIISKVAMNSIAGLLTSLVIIVLGVDFPLLWGVLVFVFNFIPTIGSALALLLIALFALLQSASWTFVLLTAGTIILIQTIIFNILEPMVIGKQIDMNPIVILLSVLLWGYLWGIVGMLVAVPLTAIIKIVLNGSGNETGKFIVDLMDQRL